MRKALAFSVLCGLLLALLPHFASWPKWGLPIWISDYDEKAYYLVFASQAFHNHPLSFTDPTLPSGGDAIVPFQVAFGVVAAKLLAGTPLLIGFFWRLFAGTTIGASLFFLCRFYLRKAWPAALAAVFLMSDVGQASVQPLFKQAKSAALLLAGRGDALLASYPQLHTHWRVLSPGLLLGFLYMYLWLLGRARETPSRARIACSGAAFGLLFYVYFYYWTAAGLGLLIALALDRAGRRAYLWTGAAGSALGLPWLIGKALLAEGRPKDWMHRIDFFLPIARSSELLFPKAAIAAAFVTFAWVWKRRRDLLPVWAFGAAALLLLNHQLLTGLQIQNFHYAFAYAPALSLLLALLGFHELAPIARNRAFKAAAIATLALHFSAGIWMRWLEGTRSRDSIATLRELELFRAQRGSDSPRLEPNAIMAGDQSFVEYSSIIENTRIFSGYMATASTRIENPEWHEREALNHLLECGDRESYSRKQKEFAEGYVWGSWARSPEGRRALYDERMRVFDEVSASPLARLEKYGLRYAAVRIQEGAQTDCLLTDRFGHWKLIESGPYWKLFERNNSI